MSEVLGLWCLLNYKSVLQELHKEHPGASRMKALAKRYLWWPGLDKCLEEKVKSCLSYQEVKNNPPHHPWIWPRPTREEVAY